MTQAFGRTPDRHRARLLGVLALAWLCTGATTLPDRGTQADQDACTPDVFKLCSDFIPARRRQTGSAAGATARHRPE